MFIIKWWRYCRGYLIISLKGRGVERLLNLAVARGIGFWDMHKQPAGARLSIALDSFRALRPLVRQTRCRVHILQKVGLPFWKYRLRRRWGLAVGAIFFCSFIYIFTSLVWIVQVTGIKHLEEAEILELAEDLGVRPGVWKHRLDLVALEEEMARRHSEITWVGIRLRGILVEIEIVEHIPEPVADHRPADLVAAKDGLVERVLVVEGEAVVAPGETVAKGDLLIRGVMVQETAPPDREGPPPVLVRAKGEVEARVWYEAVAPVRLTEIVKQDTGEFRKAYLIRRPADAAHIWGPRESPFNKSRQEVLKWTWRWRNLSLPVELIIISYYEVLVEEADIPPEKALQQARDEALAQLRQQLPEDGGTLEQLYFQEISEQGRPLVRAVAETREDIAEIRIRQP